MIIDLTDFMPMIKWVNHELFEGMITARKMKFSIKDFCSKCDQIRRKLQIWSDLLKKSFMQNFIFCARDKNMLYS